MKLGIHGEFQRVITENGIIGLIFYLFIWIKSWKRSKLELNRSVNLNLLTSEKSKYLIYAVYFPIIFFMLAQKHHLLDHLFYWA